LKIEFSYIITLNLTVTAMFDQKVKNTMDQADELFNNAKEELYKPEEDVVPYSVCRNAYKSVDKYLTGYLMQNGIEIHNSMTLDRLQQLCQDVDPKFAELDLNPMLQREDPEDIWVSMDTVRKFIDLATQTRSLVGLG
jgi:hypothetical protein